MKKYGRISKLIIAAVLTAAMLISGLYGCKRADADTADSNETPVSGEASGADTVITLSGDEITVEGEGAKVDGSTVTVSSPGTYELCGQGQACLRVVSAQKGDVTIVLNGAAITCSDGAAIVFEEVDGNAVINAWKDSENSVSDSDSRSKDGESEDACIYAACPLTVTGEGELSVTGCYGRGIFSKKTVETDINLLNVTAVDDGIRGKDGVVVYDGSINVDSGKDGIRSKDGDDGKGSIVISGGNVTVVSDGDSIYAAGDLMVTGGNLNITSGGGAANAKSSQQNEQNGPWNEEPKGMPGGDAPNGSQGGTPPQDGGGPQKDVEESSDSNIPGVSGQPMEMSDMSAADLSDALAAPLSAESTASSATSDDSVSIKGLKADGSIVISGGTLTVSSCDDSIHASGDITVSEGELLLASGDDGIHSDTVLTVSGGKLTVSQSYEGLEAETLTVSGGNISVTSSDDGLNATGQSPVMTINGGALFVDASGDGLDSNGNIIMTGGTVIVAGPVSDGDGALDCGDSGNYIQIDGGLLVAYGSSGMAEYPSADKSSQYSIGIGQSFSAGDTVQIKTSDGDTVAVFTLKKNAGSVCVSSPKLSEGDTVYVYTGVSCNGQEENGLYGDGEVTGGTLAATVELTSVTTTVGNVGGIGMSGPGGNFRQRGF